MEKNTGRLYFSVPPNTDYFQIGFNAHQGGSPKLKVYGPDGELMGTYKENASQGHIKTIELKPNKNMEIWSFEISEFSVLRDIHLINANPWAHTKRDQLRH